MKKYYTKTILLNDVDRLVYRKGCGETVEIVDISVSSAVRKGIGTQLFKILEKKTKGKHLFAITHAQNEVAQKFYESLGFEPNPLKNFYPVFPPYETGNAIMYIKQ